MKKLKLPPRPKSEKIAVTLRIEPRSVVTLAQLSARYQRPRGVVLDALLEAAK